MSGRAILVVEDDVQIGAEIEAELAGRGYAVSRSLDGCDAEQRALAGAFDLLIMDRMLPGQDGLTALAHLRAAGLTVPVLVLSALGTVGDRVRGLKAGGDDYLIKPFSLEELAARVEALLRRPAESRQTQLQTGPLTLDLIERSAARDGRTIELLPREFKLLEYLMRRPGQVVTRTMLLEDVWSYRFVPETNLVDVHIGKLRRKIDAPGEVPLLHSVRGIGFVLGAEDVGIP